MLMVLTWVKSRGTYATAGTVLEADATLTGCVGDAVNALIDEALSDCTGDGDADGEGDGDAFSNSASGSDLFLLCNE